MSGLSLRSLLIGSLLAFAIGAVSPYLGLYIQGSNASAYFTSQIAHILLFFLIGFVNVALGAIKRPWAFSKGELVVIFILMSLANSVPGILSYWVPLVSSPFYHATPENNWLNQVTPYIPTWVVPHDTGAIRAFSARCFWGRRGWTTATRCSPTEERFLVCWAAWQ